jgi:DNA-binding NarL/FixJ family response regulator
MKNIFIVEDEILVAKSMEAILSYNSYNVCGIATSYKQAKLKLASLKPDLIICDVDLGEGKTGINLIADIQDTLNTPVLFVTAFSDTQTLQEAMALKPLSFVTKPFTEKQLLSSVAMAFMAMQPAADGLLSDRERSITNLIAKGKTSKEIAVILGISLNTVESHRKNMMRKLNTSSMAEFVALAAGKGWLR